MWWTGRALLSNCQQCYNESFRPTLSTRKFSPNLCYSNFVPTQSSLSLISNLEQIREIAVLPILSSKQQAEPFPFLLNSQTLEVFERTQGSHVNGEFHFVAIRYRSSLSWSHTKHLVITTTKEKAWTFRSFPKSSKRVQSKSSLPTCFTSSSRIQRS